jgi:DedD protein
MATSAAKDKTLDPTSDAKRRARRRLVGAGVVSGLAALALAMVLDREPRPVTPDVVLKGTGNTPPLSVPLPVPVTPPAPSPAAPVVETKPAPVPVPEASKKEEPEDQRRPPLVLNPAPKEPAPKPAADPIEQLTKEKAKEKPVAEKPVAEKPAAAKSVTPATGTAPAAISGSKSGYALQVGAFANKDSANNALSKLKSAGLSGYIETISTPQGDRMRVRAGPYKDRDAAQAAHAKLKSAGIDAALIAPN